MGFENVYTYENSWKEWGNPEKFFPVETRENRLFGSMLPKPSKKGGSVQHVTRGVNSSKPASGGYVSCGG
jgi:thiosulfate/3-mercaptopyruvate sulfurtransferase